MASDLTLITVDDSVTGRPGSTRRTVTHTVGRHVAVTTAGRRTVTQLLAPVQPVHERHVAEGGPLALPDQTLQSRVLRLDGRQTVGAEIERAVVHDRAEIVRHAVVLRRLHLAEVVLGVLLDVLPQDSDVVISIRARLFVVEAERVADFVRDGAQLGTATTYADRLNPRHLSSNETNIGPAAPVFDKLNAWLLTPTRNLLELDTGVVPPELYTSLDGAPAGATGDLIAVESVLPQFGRGHGLAVLTR